MGQGINLHPIIGSIVHIPVCKSREHFIENSTFMRFFVENGPIFLDLSSIKGSIKS